MPSDLAFSLALAYEAVAANVAPLGHGHGEALALGQAEREHIGDRVPVGPQAGLGLPRVDQAREHLVERVLGVADVCPCTPGPSPPAATAGPRASASRGPVRTPVRERRRANARAAP